MPMINGSAAPQRPLILKAAMAEKVVLTRKGSFRMICPHELVSLGGKRASVQTTSASSSTRTILIVLLRGHLAAQLLLKVEEKMVERQREEVVKEVPLARRRAQNVALHPPAKRTVQPATTGGQRGVAPKVPLATSGMVLFAVTGNQANVHSETNVDVLM